MSSFASIAKQLVTPINQTNGTESKTSTKAKLDNLTLACNMGLGPEHLFRDLRDLIAECSDEEKPVKLQAIKLMIQVHGMLTQEDVQKVAPVFNIVIQGDNARINQMLCPNFSA